MRRLFTYLVSVCIFLSLAVPVIGANINPGNGISGSESLPKPVSVPAIRLAPYSTDMQDVAFQVAGVCDVAVDLEVEVSASPDFAEGSGSEGVYTGVDGTDDNFASGVYKIACYSLMFGATYYYRVKMTNGADSIYYPAQSGPGSTVEVTIAVSDMREESIPCPAFQAQEGPSGPTVQNYFLYRIWVDDGAGQIFWPLTQLDNLGAGFVGFTGDNLRDKSTGLYIDSSAGLVWHAEAYGMWDDGSSFDFWYCYNDMQLDPPAPGTFLYTTSGPSHPSRATGQTSLGVEDPTPTILYENTSTPPASIEIYYSNDNGTSWALWGTDNAPNGETWIPSTPLVDSDIYFWNVRDPSWEPMPVGLEDAEAGPYVYQLNLTSVWELRNGKNFVTFTNEVPPGWVAEDLGLDIINHIQTTYGDTITEQTDIKIYRYDSMLGSYQVAQWSMFGWSPNFNIVEDESYVIELLNSPLSAEPRSYELPSFGIVTPVIIDLYNGKNMRGIPICPIGWKAEDLALDIIDYVQVNYGDTINEQTDIKIYRYNSLLGSYQIAQWTMFGWAPNFNLEPEEGYIIELLNSPLTTDPRAYTPPIA